MCCIMKFVVGDLIVKNNIFWVILGVLNSNFIVQNINTYTREEVKEDWFNGCKKAKEEKAKEKEIAKQKKIERDGKKRNAKKNETEGE